MVKSLARRTDIDRTRTRARACVCHVFIIANRAFESLPFAHRRFLMMQNCHQDMKTFSVMNNRVNHLGSLPDTNHPTFHPYTKESNVVYGLDCSLHINVCTAFFPRQALRPFVLFPSSSLFPYFSLSISSGFSSNKIQKGINLYVIAFPA